MTWLSPKLIIVISYTQRNQKYALQKIVFIIETPNTFQLVHIVGIFILFHAGHKIVLSFGLYFNFRS